MLSNYFLFLLVTGELRGEAVLQAEALARLPSSSARTQSSGSIGLFLCLGSGGCSRLFRKD